MNKKLTFLLALTFMFLFGSFAKGGVFDKEDEGVGLYCPNWDEYFAINMKEKTVKIFSNKKDKELLENHKIIKETGVYIMSENETKKRQYFIDKHTYLDQNILMVTFVKRDKDGKIFQDTDGRCIVGDKKF
jgi:hypothetical protein